MATKNIVTNNRAARLIASIFGVLAGLGGISHGIGEILQGNVAPSGTTFNSWTVGPIATNMGREPAMTIVPNLLFTGILTIIVSLVIIVWSRMFIQRKNGGLILIVLSIGILLVGGGFAPPIIGILAGLAGLGINSKYPWWKTHLSLGIQRLFTQVWPWIFGACVINGLFLIIVSYILVYLFGMNNPGVFVASFFFAIISLLLSLFTGIGYDIHKNA
jgi:hypothetical protein